MHRLKSIDVCRTAKPGRVAVMGAAMLALQGFVPSLYAQELLDQTFEASWTNVGGGTNRYSAVTLPAPPFDTPRWVNTTDIAGRPVIYLGQAPLAVYAGQGASDGLVFAIGFIDADLGPGQPNPYRLLAVSRSTGQVVWQAEIDEPLLDSNPSATIDERNATVMVCTGYRLQAFDLASGQARWSCVTINPIVNVSPLVTHDLGPADRAFITDFKGGLPGLPTGPDARIYCLNVDAFDAVRNPYAPGAVVWSAPLGPSSGNSVSYLPRSLGGEGLVFVGSPGIYRTTPGSIRAFEVAPPGGAPVLPVWTCVNEAVLGVLGYFGGVCVVPPPIGADNGAPPSLYAATYSFFGGTDSANLVKINARTGQSIWTAPSNRTQTIPVPIPGGFVALSAGINAYMSIAMVELFADSTSTGSLLWDTSGVVNVGGWTNQPVLARFGGKNLLAVGTMPVVSEQYPNEFMLSNDLYLLDLSREPNQPGFIVRHFIGVGGCPAIVGASLYCTGTIGLAAFGPTPADLDLDASSTIDINDVIAWDRGLGPRDINRDGVVNAEDKNVLVTTLRASESSTMQGAD